MKTNLCGSPHTVKSTYIYGYRLNRGCIPKLKKQHKNSNKYVTKQLGKNTFSSTLIMIKFNPELSFPKPRK